MNFDNLLIQKTTHYLLFVEIISKNINTFIIGRQIALTAIK